MDFKEELSKYVNIVNNELEKHIRKEECPEKKLNSSMEYSLISSAKRLRPILMISSYRLFKEDYEIVFPYATAMEMIHNFSLIHDDLPAIDNDDFRHGKPTNHKAFNESTAILAGDGLLNNAYLIISENLIQEQNQEILKAKIKAFNELAYGVDRMIAGEYVDTEFEGQNISNEYLEYMHKNKTGALIKTSVRIGAILANTGEDDLERLTRYAEKIGLAFQIKDDILSEIGDEKILGKPVGNDKEHGKITFVTKYGLEKAKEILDEITGEALYEIQKYGDKGEFLKELAIYIKNRNK